MNQSIVDISREFFTDLVKPILERAFPAETAQTAFGLFGQGSEALGMDDDYSRDHHWGVRIDALMPEDVFLQKSEAMQQVLADNLPPTYQGFEIGQGLIAGAGISPDTLTGFLQRSIGLDHAPQTDEAWLHIPEEDIIHVINGEVWHDDQQTFTNIRTTFQAYYPKPVWLRRMAHWCRYFSAMGTYAHKRALLRDNELFAMLSLGKSVRWGIQLAFMLDRHYYPYDKWLFAYFKRLPRMYERLGPVVEEVISLSTDWERKQVLLDQMSDILDAAMVEDGIIQPHPKFVGSESSGYRLMEHAYKDLLSQVPDPLKTVIPQWEQIYLEKFVVGYVDALDWDTWHDLLHLSPADG
ncbi:MAG: DUF4037 domain-containing protein [Chloroflexota bacterium]